MTQPKRYRLLPTPTEPHQPGIWDNDDGTFTVYPHLTPENVEANHELAEKQDSRRLVITPARASINQVSGIRFEGFGNDARLNRYAAGNVVRALEAAISLARWLDCIAYGGEGRWPWEEEGGQSEDTCQRYEND